MFAKISLKRRLLYTASTLFFIFSSTVLTFFALGYRFNTQHGIFIYSGTITIKSIPKEISIYLDNKEITNKSYDIINNAYNVNGVKPGSHSLEIRSPGYISWKKQIDVHSGIATEFWNIVLIKKELEKKRLDIVNPSFYKIHKGGEKIIYTEQDDGPLRIFDYTVKKESAFKIFEELSNSKTRSSLENAEFSPSDNNVLLRIKKAEGCCWYLAFLDRIEKEGPNDQNFILLNPQLNQAFSSLKTKEARIQLFAEENSGENLEESNNLEEENLAENATPEEETSVLSSFKWLDDDNFYFLSQENLYLATLSKKEIRLVLERVRGYEISQGNIFSVQAPNNLVFKNDYFGSSNPKQITENLIDQDFPEGEEPFYKLFVYDEKRIALLNQNQELFLYNDNDKEHRVFKKIGDNTRGVEFSNDGKKILYFNENEIKVYYLREWDVQPKNDVGTNIKIYENKETKIQDAMWHHNYQHVIFSLGPKIQLVEIDNRGGINNLPVLESTISETLFSYDTNNKNLYFLDNSDKYIQLFSIEMEK
jgi:hypothetical protein